MLIRGIFMREEYLELNEFCDKLRISEATARNWLKQGKIAPSKMVGSKPFFSESYIASYLEDLTTGKQLALKSRRNKTFITGNSLYKAYIDQSSLNVDVIADVLHELSAISQPVEGTMALLLADCSIQLLNHVLHTSYSLETLLSACQTGDLEDPICRNLLLPILHNSLDYQKIYQTYPTLFIHEYTYLPGEDTLGCLYLSIQSMKQRKAKGSYYTPTRVVKQIKERLKNHLSPSMTYLDPCCGTGNFLLQLPEKIPITQIYGFDIDEVSVLLTRINMVLRTKGQSIDIILSHFIKKDFLMDSFHNIPEQYDVILGNPPWGYSYSSAEKNAFRQKYHVADCKSPESYDLFVEQAISHLQPKGILSFVLPEAFLQVRTHHIIRKYILDNTKLLSIDYLGNIFHGVLCPCIIFQVAKSSTRFSTKGAKIYLQDTSFKIECKRKITKEGFYLSFDDAQYQLMEKILTNPSCTFLKDHAEFVLGIVTGSNERFLTDQPAKDVSPIIKGPDIKKFYIAPISTYIRYDEKELQQTAKSSLYQVKEKLVYRFICNQLVFAYDSSGAYTLNSCNCVIPAIEGLNMKYIMAILNSRIAQYIYHLSFRSVKVLRSHIEQIPIPVVDSTIQNRIIALGDQITRQQTKALCFSLYDTLDQEIANLFALNANEYELLFQSVATNNLFLAKN